MKVIKKIIRKKINKVAEGVAIKSIGRSIPITIHEPKVPLRMHMNGVNRQLY